MTAQALPMPSGQFWYRIELDSGGKLLNCELVQQQQQARNRLVFFVLATCQSDAEVLAHRAFMERQRVVSRQRKRGHRAEGRCQCGRERDSEFRQCWHCREGCRASRERKAIRDAGGTPAPKPPKSIAFAARQAEREREIRQECVNAYAAEHRRLTEVMRNFEQTAITLQQELAAMRTERDTWKSNAEASERNRIERVHELRDELQVAENERDAAVIERDNLKAELAELDRLQEAHAQEVNGRERLTADEIRKRALLDVRQAWNDAKDYDSFVLWLVNELEELGVVR